MHLLAGDGLGSQGPGSLQTAVSSLPQFSARTTLHVSVFTPLGHGGKGGIDRQMDALVDELRGRGQPGVAITLHKTRGEGPLIFSAGLMLAAIADIAWRKLTGRIDVAHINLAHSGSVYRKVLIGKVCHLLGVPYVIHLHGSRFRQTWEGAHPWLARALRNFFEHSAATLVLGRVWADFVSDRAPAVKERVFITPSSTSDRLHAGKQGSQPVLNILFMGRLSERKGVPQLVDALKLLEHEPNWRAELAGDGEVAQTREKVRALGLEDRIGVPGWTSGVTHERLFQAADILVLPSLDENLPMTIVEAFSRRIPVVSTPVGAIADIVISEQSGLLVEPGNAVALADLLRRLLRDPSLREKLAAGGRAMFEERLNIVSYADRMMEIWRGVTGKPLR